MKFTMAHNGCTVVGVVQGMNAAGFVQRSDGTWVLVFDEPATTDAGGYSGWDFRERVGGPRGAALEAVATITNWLYRDPDDRWSHPAFDPETDYFNEAWMREYRPDLIRLLAEATAEVAENAHV